MFLLNARQILFSYSPELLFCKDARDNSRAQPDQHTHIPISPSFTAGPFALLHFRSTLDMTPRAQDIESCLIQYNGEFRVKIFFLFWFDKILRTCLEFFDLPAWNLFAHATAVAKTQSILFRTGASRSATNIQAAGRI